MKLPTKNFTLHVGITPYKVNYVTGLAYENYKLNSIVSEDNTCLELSNDDPEDVQLVAFLKEVIGLVSCWNGIHFRFEDQKPSDEDVVRCLSAQFVEIYTANPKVFPSVCLQDDFELLVGPFIWRVLLKDAVFDDNERRKGLTNYITKEVHIEKNDLYLDKLKTFWHEVFHVILGCSGSLLRFVDPSRYPSEIDIITTLGVWLAMLIKDNPEVFPCPTSKP